MTKLSRLIQLPDHPPGPGETFILVDPKTFHLIRHHAAIGERRARKKQRRIAKRGQKR